VDVPDDGVGNDRRAHARAERADLEEVVRVDVAHGHGAREPPQRVGSHSQPLSSERFRHYGTCGIT